MTIAAPPERRLLVLNPNTTEAVTAKVCAVGRLLVPATVALVPQTGRFGARYISDRASFAIAAHAALDAYALHHGTVDGVLLACFGDPGLDALTDVAGVPVTALAGASLAEAVAFGGGFSIVTGGERWKPMLTTLVRDLGHGQQLVSIETVAPTGGQIAADPDGALAIVAEACAHAADAGAATVILGGAGLVGLAARIQPFVNARVLCSTEAGFRQALARLADNPAAPLGAVPSPSVGLGADLAAILSGEHQASQRLRRL